jgi:hypothetical protein
MDEGAERPGLFAKGGVGRFLVVLTFGAIVLVAAVCGLGTVVTSSVIVHGGRHYIEAHDDELEGASNEGTAFAAGRTIAECVSEAQQRGARCTGLAPMCGMPVAMFGGACARAAIDDDYCATVPAPSEIFPSSQWKQTACAASPGIWCEPVMASIQSGCEARKKKQATDDATDDAREPE